MKFVKYLLDHLCNMFDRTSTYNGPVFNGPVYNPIFVRDQAEAAQVRKELRSSAIQHDELETEEPETPEND